MGSDLESYVSTLKAAFSGSDTLPRREFLPGVSLSVVGAGALMLCGLPQIEADRLVSESFDRGVNYFDTAPSYGAGEAEEKLGLALHPFRTHIFLACKTLQRSYAGVRLDLEQSLRRLRCDSVDLYQLHAVNKSADLESIFAPEGAMEALLRAREQGLIGRIGFSSHSVPLALAMMDRFPFDSVLFPVNFVCWQKGRFGPQVLEKARRRGIGRIALKTLALRAWKAGDDRAYPNCWYRPIDEPRLALQAIRFTLSEDVSAFFPPADPRLFRMALALAPYATPLTAAERSALLASASSLKPIMTAPKNSG